MIYGKTEDELTSVMANNKIHPRPEINSQVSVTHEINEGYRLDNASRRSSLIVQSILFRQSCSPTSYLLQRSLSGFSSNPNKPQAKLLLHSWALRTPIRHYNHPYPCQHHRCQS